MSNFSIPERPIAEVISVLEALSIANLRPEDLLNPTADVIIPLYNNFLCDVDPLAEAEDGQIGFDALELLDNPDHHVSSIKTLHLYKKVKDVLDSICYGNFHLTDLLKPDPRKTLNILNTMVNFLLYREEKVNGMQPIVNKLASYGERKTDLENKIIQYNKELMDYEVARQLEEPLVQEVDAEIKKLQQAVQNYNKQQMSLKTIANELKEKTIAISDKISLADFELMKSSHENTKLRSKVVQSPDKLQKAHEEKLAQRAELKNSEQFAIQSVKQKKITLDLSLKASKKLSKLISRTQDIQTKVNKAKDIDKEVKAYKSKLNEEETSNVCLETNIDEWRGKVKKVKERSKSKAEERQTRIAEESQHFERLRKELEQKLQFLEPKEKAAEAMASKGANLRKEADSVIKAGKVEQRKLLLKLEEIVDAFNSYTDMIESSLVPLESLEGRDHSKLSDNST